MAPRLRHLLILSLLAPAVAAPQGSLEYGVKAVFLERFARFVEWPTGALGGDRDPFVITVVGDDPFQGLLEQAYAERRIRGRPVTVRHARTPAEAGDCHLLYVGARNPAVLAEVVSRMRGRPTLLVAEIPGGASAGAHVNFFLDGPNVRFEVNAEAARESGLAVSYLLMQAARPAPGGGGAR